MTRRILLLLAIAGVAFADDGLAKPKNSATKPNLIYILCDDLGYGDLGCFGHPIIQTPNLDRLTAGGMKLTHCYASAPVCSPSRAGALTGRIPQRLGIRDWIPPGTGTYLKTNEVTVAELLRAAGYRTAHIGKWHLSSRLDGSEPTPRDHGFDYWFATQNNAAPSHQNPTNFVRNGTAVGPLQGNCTSIVMDETIGFIRANRDQPLLVFVWFHAPHEPVATPEEFTRRYPGFDDPTEPIYYGSVSLLDHEVGRLMRALDESGLRANTLVMFTSDNGPETLRRYPTAVHSHGSPGPLRGMKLHLTEGGIRVPGILYWPARIKPGQTSDEPVSNVDVLPTFCDLAGVPSPSGLALDGASLTPIFAGKAIRRKTPLYWQYDKALGAPWTIAMRDGPWKLLANATLDRFALYNLPEDVGEARPVTDKSPRRVREMEQALRRVHQEINASASR